MNFDELYTFLHKETLAVLSTCTLHGIPESALMGIAVTRQLEIIFDTLNTTRKYPNLKQNPRVSLVIGCSSEVTVQYQGIAEELTGDALLRYKPIYFETFPDGPARENWSGMTYFLVRPTWIRFCDYNPATRRIEEHRFDSPAK